MSLEHSVQHSSNHPQPIDTTLDTKRLVIPARRPFYNDICESRDLETILNTEIMPGAEFYTLKWATKLSPAKTFKYIESTVTYYTQNRKTPRSRGGIYPPSLTCLIPNDVSQHLVDIPYQRPFSWWGHVAIHSPLSVRFETEAGTFILDALTKNCCRLIVNTHHSDIAGLARLANKTTRGGISVEDADGFITESSNQLLLMRESINRAIHNPNRTLQ